MTDSIYSASLLLALICASLAAGLRVIRRLRTASLDSAKRTGISGVAPLLVLSLIAAGTSLGVHAIYGHGASSPEPMTAAEFAIEHRAYWFLAALWLLLWVAGPTSKPPRSPNA